MNSLTYNSGDLSNAISTANTMATAVGGTFTSNAGWLVLIATAGLIIGITLSVLALIAHLGRPVSLINRNVSKEGRSVRIFNNALENERLITRRGTIRRGKKVARRVEQLRREMP